MESFPKILARSAAAALLGLLFGGIVGFAGFAGYKVLESTDNLIIAAFGAALGLGWFALAAVVFFLPALLFFAPAYALLFKFRYANYLTLTAVGVLPWLLVPLAPQLIEPAPHGLVLLVGILSGWGTHFFGRLFLRHLVARRAYAG